MDILAEILAGHIKSTDASKSYLFRLLDTTGNYSVNYINSLQHSVTIYTNDVCIFVFIIKTNIK